MSSILYGWNTQWYLNSTYQKRKTNMWLRVMLQSWNVKFQALSQILFTSTHGSMWTMAVSLRLTLHRRMVRFVIWMFPVQIPELIITQNHSWKHVDRFEPFTMLFVMQIFVSFDFDSRNSVVWSGSRQWICHSRECGRYDLWNTFVCRRICLCGPVDWFRWWNILSGKWTTDWLPSHIFNCSWNIRSFETFLFYLFALNLPIDCVRNWQIEH